MRCKHDSKSSLCSMQLLTVHTYLSINREENHQIHNLSKLTKIFFIPVQPNRMKIWSFQVQLDAIYMYLHIRMPIKAGINLMKLTTASEMTTIMDLFLIAIVICERTGSLSTCLNPS